MTWGPYYFFYDCPQCGKKYRWLLENMSDKSFGRCPACDISGVLTGETRDIKHGERSFEDYEYI